MASENVFYVGSAQKTLVDGLSGFRVEIVNGNYQKKKIQKKSTTIISYCLSYS